ncbi:hypothetical protein BJF92_13600 [Rhizobium rhizosphaerae]|uniref:AAA+ ATPase domain-containing protein n=1 Tax=Xaviernesmea rhizosphaerae TaxID=1672749 RepID=A0A1Q9AHV7_9HYPH|nr:AAA family ATPase [Xaviernesmea rhizosphaerae]OLP54839.1 hypothetical protein BJF92_13600 [Xaviernesmea rhizosphaerae]
MSRYDTTPSFEGRIAHHHIVDFIATIGSAPQGTYILAVPPTTEAEVWVAPALTYFRDIREVASNASADLEDAVDAGIKVEPYDINLLTAEGLFAGRTTARCTLYVTEHGHADLRHPSVRMADNLIYIDLDPKLVQKAAADVGRPVTIDEAELLAEMPRRHRRLALVSGRAITESYELHLITLEQEAALKAAGTVTRADKKKTTTERPRSVPTGVGLEDLHGYGEAKGWGLEVARDVMDFVNGDIRWDDVDGGILLSGPPGCGKTSFARALATTANCHFVAGSYASWQAHGHQGDMLAAMRSAFDEAVRCAPSVLLIDEIDGFMDRARDKENSDYLRNVVNGILELLDGSFDRTGVIVIGATNHPDTVDPAIRRSGRLDRHVKIGLPDAEARLAILRQHLGVGEDFALKAFTHHTEGMSGADLERIARDARRLARRERAELRHTHVAKAFPRREPRTRSELRHIAVHEIGHAVVAAALGATVQEVFVRGDRDPALSAEVAGAAVIAPLAGRRDREWYLDRAAHLLGGLAAETLVFGEHADGVVVDLQEATNLVTFALVSVGMGGTLASDGHVDPEALATARMYDPALKRHVDEVLHEQAERAREILEAHAEAVEELIELLILRRRLDGAVVADTMTSCAARAPAQLSLTV